MLNVPCAKMLQEKSAQHASQKVSSFQYEEQWRAFTFPVTVRDGYFLLYVIIPLQLLFS